MTMLFKPAEVTSAYLKAGLTGFANMSSPCVSIGAAFSDNDRAGAIWPALKCSGRCAGFIFIEPHDELVDQSK
jgi:hypothetical protein